MTPELWERITELYEAASDLHGRERREFLDRECAADEELRREVESLLSADINAGDFIMTPAVGAVESWSGQFVAHYQIMSRIGSGGMGEVYLARDSKLNRMVALKTLPFLMSDHPAFLQRFEKEAQSAAAMNHPNVAVVYSVEEAGKQKFITMEYVEGKTLDEFIRPNGLDLKTFLDWFVQITDALAHAHAKGIVHRDIKPGNIMITTSRTPKVLDFGLAQPIGAVPAGSTGPGGKEPVFGTPSYMSPEQGQGKEVDTHSDIFSLGVVMYEALTGMRPFTGTDNASLIRDLVTRDPVRVSRLRQQLPKELYSLITRCLNKDPEKRPVSMDWVRSQLERISISEFGVSGEGLPADIGQPPASRRGPAAAYSAAGMGLLAIFAYAAYTFLGTSAGPAMSFETIVPRRLSQTNNVIFAHILPDGKSYVYSTNEPDDHRSLWIRRIADNQVLQLLPSEPVSYWGGFTASRDGGHAYYIAAGRDDRHGTLYRISTLGGTPRKIADSVNDLGNISPDNSRILYVRYGPAMSLLAANAEDGSGERIILEGKPNEILRDPQFSHDGKHIYLIRVARTSGGELWSLEEIDLNGRIQRVLLPPRKTRISEIAVVSGGGGLLVNAVEPLSNLPQIVHVSLADGSESRITNDLNTYVGLSISDDASRVVTVQRNFFKDIWVGSGGDISVYKKVTFESNANLRVNWTPDGRLVYDAVDNNRPNIRIMNADGTGVEQLTPADTLDFEPRVSPDGRHIVFTSHRSGERRVWRIGTDGSGPVMLTQVAGTAGRPMISPNGENVYFVWTKDNSKSTGVVPIIGGPVVELPLFSETYEAISPDGKQLAYALYSEAEKRFYVGIRPLDRTEPSAVFKISPTWFLDWSPKSDGLYYREMEPGDGSESTVLFQPLSGGPPQLYLSVAPDQIFDLDISPDGTRTALIRGRYASDAVLLSRIGNDER